MNNIYTDVYILIYYIPKFNKYNQIILYYYLKDIRVCNVKSDSLK